MTPSSKTVTELLADAAHWRLLGLLFACPRGDWHEQVATLAAEVRDDKLRIAARVALEEASPTDYHTAFGPGGPAAPREVSHRQAALTGQYLAELFAAYSAFAFSAPRDEPPDHIATEIDFIAYLRLKQAFAVARNDETHAAVTAEAAQSFIQDHLATTAVPLVPILEASSIPYLTLAGAALAERIAAYRTETLTASPELNESDDCWLPMEDACGCCTQVFHAEPSTSADEFARIQPKI